MTIFPGTRRHRTASLFSKVGVNVATAIWAIIVLSRSNALDGKRFPFYQWMISVMPENAWATGALCFVALAIYRLWSDALPRWWGAVGYSLMMIFWCYLAISLLLELPRSPLGPASFACITVVAGLSVIAFVSNPKTDDDTCNK